MMVIAVVAYNLTEIHDKKKYSARIESKSKYFFREIRMVKIRYSRFEVEDRSHQNPDKINT